MNKEVARLLKNGESVTFYKMNASFGNPHALTPRVDVECRYQLHDQHQPYAHLWIDLVFQKSIPVPEETLRKVRERIIKNGLSADKVILEGNQICFMRSYPLSFRQFRDDMYEILMELGRIFSREISHHCSTYDTLCFSEAWKFGS